MDSLLSDIISLQTVDPQVDGDLSLIEPTLAQMSSTVSVPHICVRYTTVDDALSLNLLQESLCLSKLLITKLYVKSNQSNHTN